LARIKNVSIKRHIDTVLAKNILQFRLLAAKCIRIPTGEAKGSNQIRPPSTCCHIRPRSETRSSSQRVRAVHVGREYMDVRNERVSSTHASRGRRSRRSKFSSIGKAEFWVGTTSLGVLILAVRSFDTRGCFLLPLPSSRLCGCSRFGHRLPTPCRVPGDSHVRQLERQRDRMKKGFGLGVE
jgi:hypothetical protein